MPERRRVVTVAGYPITSKQTPACRYSIEVEEYTARSRDRYDFTSDTGEAQSVLDWCQSQFDEQCKTEAPSREACSDYLDRTASLDELRIAREERSTRQTRRALRCRISCIVEKFNPAFEFDSDPGGAQLHHVLAPVYMNSSCQHVPLEQYRDCGAINLKFWHISPVSLLWDTDQLPPGHTNSSFPLDPELRGKWYKWRASEKAPLVVHDPRHTGVINDGTQLFGTSTFGRKWKNGYEALSSIDGNGDGKLSGSELDDLGLWFDKDRDSVSQPGEVKTLTEAGVVALYFQPDHTDLEQGEIFASLGYERRNRAGVIESGPSVDWLSPVFERDTGETSASPRPYSPELSALEGIWSWHSPSGVEGFETAGEFIFVERNGKIAGVSIVERNVFDRLFQKSSGLLGSFPLLGGLEMGQNGLVELVFEVSNSDGSKTVNRARLSEDKRTLTGTSKERSKGNGKDELLRTYAWVATRQRT